LEKSCSDILQQGDRKGRSYISLEKSDSSIPVIIGSGSLWWLQYAADEETYSYANTITDAGTGATIADEGG